MHSMHQSPVFFTLVFLDITLSSLKKHESMLYSELRNRYPGFMTGCFVDIAAAFLMALVEQDPFVVRMAMRSYG